MEIGRFDFDDRLNGYKELTVDVETRCACSLATIFIGKGDALRIIAHLQQVFELEDV